MFMEIDFEKIDDVALALLYLTLHDGNRAWKGMDWNVSTRLFEKGYLHNPRNKNKSVSFTEEGLQKSKSLFEKYFTKSLDNENKT